MSRIRGNIDKNAKFVANLGLVGYLSAVRRAKFVLGNSSSGIIEAPVIGTPTVNIGDRQQGRLMADTVVCCEPRSDAIENAMIIAEKMEHCPSYLYGDGKTSDKIIEIIKNILQDEMELKKVFYDLKTVD